jgi:hypothetical protein
MILVPDIDPPFQLTGIAFPPLHKRFQREGECWFREVGLHVGNEGRLINSWKTNKRKWVERGFSMRSDNGKWFVQQWLTHSEQGYALTEAGEGRLAVLNAPVPEQEEIKFAAPLIVLPELHSNLLQKLRPYQVNPAKQIFRALSQGWNEWGYPGAVDFSEVGLGKTYMDLAAAIATGKEIIVLCPVVGEEGWRQAFAHFGVTPRFITTYEAVRGGWRSHVCTMDGEGVFHWQNPSKIVLILDEAQALRHDDTLTVRCCSAAIRQRIPIIGASATIALSPLEMRFAGRITGLHNGEGDWTRFLQDHGCVQTSGGGWKWDRREAHLVKINSKLFPARGARVVREDLGDECPETIITTLPIKTSESDRLEAQWRETVEMLDRMKMQMADAKFKVVERNARMRVWKMAESTLVKPLAEIIREDIEEGFSVAAFLNFNESRIRLSQELNCFAGFYGGMNAEKRKYYQREFQANKLHLLINNVKAGGASVSLHDIHGARPRKSYICMSDDAIRIAQCLGRVDRFGSKSVSQQFLTYAAGSITERMVVGVRAKMRRLARINDGHAMKTPTF